MRIVDPALQELRNKLLRMGSLAEAILEKSLVAVCNAWLRLASPLKAACWKARHASSIRVSSSAWNTACRSCGSSWQ